MSDTFSRSQIGRMQSANPLLNCGQTRTRADKSGNVRVAYAEGKSDRHGQSPLGDVRLSVPDAVVICPKSAKPTRSNKLETHRNGSCVNPYQHQKVLSDGGADAGVSERSPSTHTKILESESDNEKSSR